MFFLVAFAHSLVFQSRGVGGGEYLFYQSICLICGMDWFCSRSVINDRCWLSKRVFVARDSDVSLATASVHCSRHEAKGL